MAFVTQFTCSNCRETRHEVVTPSRICARCRGVLARVKKDAHMGQLVALPLPERIRRIEEQLYELDAEKRITALEVHHIKY